MHFTTPYHRMMDAILRDVVGFEVDGVRVLEAQFGRPFSALDDDSDAILVTLIITDTADDELTWPREATKAISDLAYDAIRRIDPWMDSVVLLRSEHPNYGNGRETR
ncbi:hypothetical protein [Conexibacter woesei]|uniref:Uncharacterized protein n=1 Tax=Conexibacter woesei (strain DSM 14684 / CCUG 47730 / CIP 108061 / JCM 11494 / NBRC 100937 / ID131577) TaxID=469383 RepID=D3FAA2_CONWI|nr:hypothetical protein [Conexibacter woesei]ADB49171.1 hypothetical protein Cwoe_0738 [Conexibacter woesei DSM 14684]